MNCETAREAISALLDDELGSRDRAALEDHLLRCPECCRWQSLAHEVTRNARLEPARTIPTRADVLVSEVLGRSRPPRRPTNLTWARIGLVAVAAAQAAITVPSLFYGEDHTAPVHVAHEVGAFAMALAVGFLVAAWRPERARGMRTVVGATAALLVVTAAIDLVRGRTDFGDEAPHLLAVTGWLLLVYVAAATPSTSFDPSWSIMPVMHRVSGRHSPTGPATPARTPTRVERRAG